MEMNVDSTWIWAYAVAMIVTIIIGTVIIVIAQLKRCVARKRYEAFSKLRLRIAMGDTATAIRSRRRKPDA